MYVLRHKKEQSESQINPLACFHLLGRGTQARVSRGVWVQTGFCLRKLGRKVTHGSDGIGGTAAKPQCPLLHYENHTGLNSTMSAWLTRIFYPCVDWIHLI